MVTLHVKRPPRSKYGTPDFDLLEQAFIASYPVEKTRDGYCDDLDFYAWWCHQRGVDPLKTVRNDIEMYARTMEVDGYAPRTRDRRIRTVHLFFQRLIEEELATKDPTARVKRPKIPRISSTLGLSTREQADIFSAAQLGDRPNEFALICLLEFNGHRNAEVGAFYGSTTITLTVKGGERVTDKLAPMTAYAVQQAIGTRTSGPILLNRYGNRMTGDNARHIVARLARQVGITRRITPHSFRHSLVTSLRDEGLPDRDIMVATHHRDPRMIDFYDRGRGNLMRHPTDRAAARVLAMT